MGKMLPSPVEREVRVVSISSNGHAISPFRFTDWNFEGSKTLLSEEEPSKRLCAAYGLPWGTGYLPAVAYGQNKTANILHAAEQSGRSKGGNLAAFSLHPGAIVTDLWRAMDEGAKKCGIRCATDEDIGARRGYYACGCF